MKQDKQISMRLNYQAYEIPVQCLIQYIPYQKEINGKTFQDYYAIQYLREYIPQYVPTKQMNKGKLRWYQELQYLPVETQIVHYPRNFKIFQMESKIQNMQKLLEMKDVQLKNYQQKLRYHEKQKEQQQLKKEKQQNQFFGLCKICLDKKASFFNKNCGHLCLCQQHSSLEKCPLCNKQGQFMIVYSSRLISQ